MAERQNNETFRLPKRNIKNWLRDKLIVDPENSMRLVYPLASFIHEERPDYILAIDSGARIASLALVALYHELYGELPTKDHSIHFKKVSHSFPFRLVKRQLQGDVKQALTACETPLFFVIDDCVNTGLTAAMIRKAISQLSNGRINVRFGVMREFLARVTDVKGDTFSLARPTWRNKQSLIGVEYLDGTTPQVIRSSAALNLRRQIRSSATLFAEKIKGSQ